MPADSQRIFPVDDFVKEGLYPGYRQAFGSQPFVAGPVRPFSLADNERYWLRDSLHFSEGMVPASIATLDDAQTWGAQLGAEIVGVPPTRGSVNRLAGTHVYIGTIDVDTPWQVQARAARFGQYVSPILADFDSYWAMRAAELTAAYEHFDNLDLSAMPPAELWTVLKDAYAFHRRAWFIHFEVMYVLTANYLAFYALAEEIGLSGSQVSAFLAGQQTFYGRTDEELWRLAGLARSLDVTAPLTHSDPASMRAEIAALPRGKAWLSEFDAFLAVYGQRTEETCRVDTPSWIEDPSPALYAIGGFLAKPAGFDFHNARSAAIAERDAQIDEARRHVNGGDLRRFNEALASNQAANFAWWNEEHNYLIDRRAAIPVRRATLELGARLAADGRIERPDDMFFLFKPELFAAMESGGGTSWQELAAMIPDRRAYFEHWRERGPSLPTMLGTIPHTVPDPIMIEVFGLSGHFLETLRGDGSGGDGTGEEGTEIRGFPAAKGVVEGVARVITTVTDLHSVLPGEILVCGGTTTEWTPAFGIIAACVCDTGGSLTHAAIVSREYGIPCVVGTAVATQVIKTGDRVRVDGRAGTVRVLA
ncbi:PEP-utilizing protein mobile subunit [Trebonia kvetii]|uniref:PEP-utilizing protein mobile subunit n=1 Tax=Trebonia kvetii TaxID=2480626 RepID=A0A6P2BQ78_9ACTN|nr:PEP-utilizing enzyme [Trebonia kvetii]TVZ01192.1 PEP-utilizing protein mobile subunit [Trebonia kvetii]